MAETSLVRYETMCRAIAECLAVDEAKDIRDKAVALEVYARQSNNFDAERQAQEVRVRAEKRCGQLLRESSEANARAARGRPKNVESNDIKPMTLSKIGITRDQSSQWQQLADVPDETFESVLADKSEPISAARVLNVHRTNTGAAPATRKIEPVNMQSIHLWGQLRDVVRNLKDIDIAEAIREMPDTLREGMLASAHELYGLLDSIGREYERAQRNR